MELTFTGVVIRWYGQKDANFGTAAVYLDNELAGAVNANGTMAAEQLLFERVGLTAGEHTIRIVCSTRVIDVDYLAYTG